MKRMVVISDLHCGHLVGLTHPDFDGRPNDPTSAHYKLWQTRRKCWRWYKRKIAELQPVDILIVNGDCIDGKGKKSGGTELLQPDRGEQVDMAAAAIEMVDAKTVVMTYGTPYHTGVDEDWENQVAKHKSVDAYKIGGHDQFDVNGVVVDYRHFIGGSSIPHGRFTAIARERLWNMLWAEYDEYPKADIIIRSHVHYHIYCGEELSWFAMTTPPLQAYGSKFGTRKMSGKVHFGIVHFDIESRLEWSWKSHILRFPKRRAAILRL